MTIIFSILEVGLSIFCTMALGIYLAYKDEIHYRLDKLFCGNKGGED